MKDPVALAWSGRREEAAAAALAAVRSDDAFQQAQGLEAFAVLARESGWTAGPEVASRVEALARSAGGSVGRKAWEAAAALALASLQAEAEAQVRSGRAGWVLLRYAGEVPSTGLGAALVAGWAQVDASLRDEALLALAVQPVADVADQSLRMALALEASRSPVAALRQAAAHVLPVLAPEAAADRLQSLAEDDDDEVRAAASAALRRHAESTLCWGRWCAPPRVDDAAPVTPVRATKARRPKPR